jgi:hypothetical protein
MRRCVVDKKMVVDVDVARQQQTEKLNPVAGENGIDVVFCSMTFEPGRWKWESLARPKIAPPEKVVEKRKWGRGPFRNRGLGRVADPPDISLPATTTRSGLPQPGFTILLRCQQFSTRSTSTSHDASSYPRRKRRRDWNKFVLPDGSSYLLLRARSFSKQISGTLC